MKTAIIYARVSSSGSQENRQSNERQINSLSEYASLNGYDVEKAFEEHISGGKKNSERSGLIECLNYARDNKIQTILVSELSRFGRQIWEVLESIKFCVDNGINVYFQKEGLELFDGNKVNGVMAIYISCLSFCAEKERENIAFRLSQGRELLKEGNKEIANAETQLRKRLTEVEKQINDTKLRYAVGKIDDEIYQVAIEELQDRKNRILLEVENCRNTLSNSESEVYEIIATCCNLGTLWNDSDLETKIKVQHLVFPNGIFWNHENGCYRTPEKGLVFNIIDSISGVYKRKTEAVCSASVIECG